MGFFIVVIRVSIVNSVVMTIRIIRVPSVGSIITVISFILMLLGFLGLLGLFWRKSDISSQVSMLRLTFYLEYDRESMVGLAQSVCHSTLCLFACDSTYSGLLVLLGLFKLY